MHKLRYIVISFLVLFLFSNCSKVVGSGSGKDKSLSVGCKGMPMALNMAGPLIGSVGGGDGLGMLSDLSIEDYKRILQSSKDGIVKSDALKMLFYLYKDIDNDQEAFRYACMYIMSTDSIGRPQRKDMQVSADSQLGTPIVGSYDNQSNDKSQLYRSLFYAVSSSLFILILCIISFAVYKKNTYNKQILSMKESMNTLYSDKERLREANESYLSMLHKVEFKESAEDVVAGLRRRINGPGQLSDEDWKRFYNAVDKLYPDFRSIVVGNLADITEQKMQTCYLLRVGFTASQIHNLTDIPRATVYRWIKSFSWVVNREVKSLPGCHAE